MRQGWRKGGHFRCDEPYGALRAAPWSRHTPAGDPLPNERLKVRGVPAAFFEEGQRLEIYTSSVSIVIFGAGKEQLLRAAGQLRGVNASAKGDRR
jgi:hypothetical protein